MLLGQKNEIKKFSFVKKNVIIYHSPISEASTKDDLDVLEEANFFFQNLQKLNYQPIILPFEVNLQQIISEIKIHYPEFVVNLVETINGNGKMIAVAPLIFEHLKLKYTGNSAESIFKTSDKLIAKDLFLRYEIPTPKYFSLTTSNEINIEKNEQFLLKSRWEHASIGLENKLFNDKTLIINKLENYLKEGKEFFAEKYIDGREFNISILSLDSKPFVLPFAEMKFIDFPNEKPKIISYDAKWNENSFDYQHTQRSFETSEKDSELFSELKFICEKIWKVFSLRGYVRVDFRIDKNNSPYVLEVNTNPCISLDSGFLAATEQAHLSHTEIISQIIKDMNKNF